MKTAKPFNAKDALGFGRLGLSSFTGIVDLVESMHATIARRVSPFNTIANDSTTTGITGLVYRSIRVLPGALSSGIDALLPAIRKLEQENATSLERNSAIAILNGVLGDHLERSGNPLAIPMTCRSNGQNLTLQRQALAEALPHANGKILLLIHGLCMHDLQWTRDGHSHGSRLGADLGYTEIHLRYNSGRHISENGSELADLVETLLAQWPTQVDELVIVAHSMGGLVSRSALHYASLARHHWPRSLHKLIFLGTPHHGSPLERGGNLLDTALGFSPFTAPFTRLGMIRSAGITDLRYGNLRHEDWNIADRFEHRGDPRQPLPLPTGIEYYALAATKTAQDGVLANDLIGDGMVPVHSALGQHREPAFCLAIPEDHKAVVYLMGHFDLLGRDVYDQVHHWLAA